MRALLTFLAALSVAACDTEAFKLPQKLTGADLNASVTDARRFLGENSTIIAICGPSQGTGLFLDEISEGFVSDRISDGVIAFGLNADGEPDIVHRDTFKEMAVMSEGGAKVSVMPTSTEESLGVWVIEFPNSQIVETHNLTRGEDNELYDLWTTNKPKRLIAGRVMAFISKCDFVDA